MSYKKAPKYKPKKKALFSLAPHNIARLQCRHPKELWYIKTISSAVNCETTIVACSFCGKHLTKPKTDC